MQTRHSDHACKQATLCNTHHFQATGCCCPHAPISSHRWRAIVAHITPTALHTHSSNVSAAAVKMSLTRQVAAKSLHLHNDISEMHRNLEPIQRTLHHLLDVCSVLSLSSATLTNETVA